MIGIAVVYIISCHFGSATWRLRYNSLTWHEKMQTRTIPAIPFGGPHVAEPKWDITIHQFGTPRQLPYKACYYVKTDNSCYTILEVPMWQTRIVASSPTTWHRETVPFHGRILWKGTQSLLFHLEAFLWCTLIGYITTCHLGPQDSSLTLYDTMFRQCLLLYMDVPYGRSNSGSNTRQLGPWYNSITWNDEMQTTVIRSPLIKWTFQVTCLINKISQHY